MSIGRGTYNPFEVIGYPDSTFGEFTFTPISIDGMSKYPKYQDTQCFGIDLKQTSSDDRIDLSFLINYYSRFESPEEFFNDYFDVLAGTDQLREQIIAGMNEEEIRQSWQAELNQYKAIRSKYLLYE